MQEVVLPKLGLTMEEGTIRRWLVEEGQPVEKGAYLFEVETDKVTVEVEADRAGILGRIVVPEGETRPVGTTIAYLLEEGEELPAELAEEAGVPPGEERQGAPLEERRAAPAPEKVRASPAARKLAQDAGLELGAIDGSGPQGRITREDVEAHLETRRRAPAAEAPPAPEGKLRASPAARRAAREAGLELRRIQGTGPKGRIIEADVLDFAAAAAQAQVYQPTRIERVMAQRMAQSFGQAPHFYLTIELDASRLVELRRGLVGPIEERTGVRLTYTDLLLKILAETLTGHPKLNASWEEGTIRLHKQVNLGMAVAVEEGLIVPVLHDVASMTLTELAQERAALARRAAEGKLRLEDLEGATFTLSNLGMFEIDLFQAILNPPQAAILATGAIKERPANVEGRLALRPSLYMSLSVDHRVTDGATAARFLQDLKGRLQEPYRVLLP